MGDYTNHVTDADRDTAKLAVGFMKERAQGNPVEFERQVIEYCAAQLAFARESQRLLHEKELGISEKK